MLGKALTTAAAGSAGAAGGLGIEDVFSTFLYTGNNSTQTITNELDLSGEGGLVWLKSRLSASGHQVYDTSRGATAMLDSSTSDASQTISTGLTAFNSDGFSIGDNGGINNNNGQYVSWSFRKAPGFFDVVTYTGNGTAGRTVSHNLGSVPGCMIVKRTDATGQWYVYHRSLGATGGLLLSETDAFNTAASFWNNTSPTSSVFTLGSGGTNDSGGSYVAYLFAHDEQTFGESGSESVIKCGTVSIGGTGTFDVNLGWEPQWVLFKYSGGGGGVTPNWYMSDNMRNFNLPAFTYLWANTTATETTLSGEGKFFPYASGFKSTASSFNSGNYIYVAIRRGPMKTPTDATTVFNTITRSGTGSATSITAGFAPDMWMPCIRSSTVGMSSYAAPFDKLRGPYRFLRVTSTGSELNITNTLTAYTNTGVEVGNDNVWMPINGTGNNYANWAFRRAPGFFDVVAYTGTGSTSSNTGQQDITHNLGVVPELILVKGRDYSSDFTVYNAASGAGTNMRLNRSNADISDIYCWDNTTPTSSVFRVGAALNGDTNVNTKNYIAYLFATVSGVSKVGSYSGTGSDVNVDCGFSAGARFVLIKRTDSTGGWYVWDTARGITAGNDPYLLLNSGAAEVTTTDYIDPYSAGFTISSSAPAAINASGGTYLFLAIA